MLFPTHVGVSDSRDRKAFTYLPAALIVLLVLLVIAVAVMMTRNRGESGGEDDTTLPQITDGTTASLGGNTPIGKPPALTLPSAPEKSRRLTSKTGTYLNLYIDYTTVDNGDTITVTASVGIDCYSISVGARKDLGEITINGKTQTFSSPKITKEENVRSSIHFETLVFTVPKHISGETTLNISASWIFNGVYGGKELGTITINETITVSHN